VVAVAVVSFLPADTKHALHTRGRFHSWGHFLIFSVVGYIAAGIARSPRARVLFFIGCLVFGFGIELAEHIVYQSGLEWKDVIVDAVGAGFGTVLALVTAPKTAD
jgi:VanZ family protein